MIVTSLENPSTYKKIYNLPGDGCYEFQEILAIISQLLGLKRLIISLPGRPLLLLLRIYESLFSQPLLTSSQVKKWIKHQALDTSLIKKDLNYNPISFKEGIYNKTSMKILTNIDRDDKL